MTMNFITSLFDNRYKLLKNLGEGSFGSVYSATDTHINRTVVLKIAICSLAHEAQVYEVLNRNPTPVGVPRMARYAVINTAEYIVMQRLGKCLQYYWEQCNNCFSLKTVVMLGIQMISRLESLHSRGIVHGDIKEDNFVMDEQCRTLYIIDFGGSCFYIDQSTGTHIPEERDEDVLGTLVYAAINTHNKFPKSRRDDLESIAYMLIRLFKGSLPWEDEHLRGKTFAETFDNIGEVKMHTGIEYLCDGLPKQFKTLLAYIRRLGFAERPNYAHLDRLLRSSLDGQNLNIDGVYDWMVRDTDALVM